MRIRRAAIIASGVLIVLTTSGCGLLGSRPDAEAARRELGVCYDVGADLGHFGALPTVDCDEPHVGEVIGVMELPEGDYPGADALDIEGEAFCLSAFAEYVGIDYAESSLYMTAFWPTGATWSAGDRQIVCVTVSPTGAPLVGSVRDTRG
jgi:hypothetical protein